MVTSSATSRDPLVEAGAWEGLWSFSIAGIQTASTRTPPQSSPVEDPVILLHAQATNQAELTRGSPPPCTRCEMGLSRGGLKRLLKHREDSNRKFLERREREANEILKMHKKTRKEKLKVFKKQHPGVWQCLLSLCAQTRKNAGHWMILSEQVIRLRRGQAPLPMPKPKHAVPPAKRKRYADVLEETAMGMHPLSELAEAVGVLRNDTHRPRQKLIFRMPAPRQ